MPTQPIMGHSPTPVPPLPHTVRPELQESAYRRYENVFAAAITSYPAAVEFNCHVAGISPNTARSRLRDVINSWLLFQWAGDWWPSDDVNMRREIGQRAGQLKVYPHPTEPLIVLIGPVARHGVKQMDIPVHNTSVTKLPEQQTGPWQHTLEFDIASAVDDPTTTLSQVVTCFGFLMTTGVLQKGYRLAIADSRATLTADYVMEVITPITTNFGLIITPDRGFLILS